MNFISIALQGIFTGTILTMSFGAGFFALIQTSLTRGYKKGLLIASGALVSDALFIGLALFATSFVNNELPKYAQIFRSVGLVAFCWLGIRTIMKSSKVIRAGESDAEKSTVYYLTKGFVLNVVNPLILITWLGITVFLQSTLNYGYLELFTYFTFVMLATFFSQALICVFSHKIKRHLSDLLMHRLNIIIGIVFIALGIAIFMNQGNPGTEFEKARQIIK